MTVTYIWLLTGVVLMVIDAIGLSGIGLLFAGLGAIATGVAVSINLVGPDSRIEQWIIFFVATAVSAFALWKPMQRIRIGNKHAGYSNIVGETAYVGSSGLAKNRDGEVTWSGTIMKAQLFKGAAVDHLDAGAQVVIVEVSGATLIVQPKT